MKTTKFFLLTILNVTICFNVLFAQPENIVPVTPEAAALSKMVNYPVNLNTGIPDINIPFYEINVGGMSLPITLNYHAGGFKINEQATRAGLGWSLSSDLQITRTVNGLDDLFAANGYIYNSLVKAFYSNYMTCPSCSYPLMSTTPFPYANTYDLAFGNKDGMPDKFNYKLLNKSGSFYFQKNSAGTSYTIVPVPFDNIKIQFEDGFFIITDTDGTVYYFGDPNGIDALGMGIEVSGDIGVGTCTNCVVTAWKCKRIVGANKIDEISFVYTKKTVTTYKTYSDRIEYYSNENPCGISPYYIPNQSPTQYNNYEHLVGMVPFYKISSPKYLEVIGSKGISKFHVPYVDASLNVIDKVYDKIDNSNASNTDIAGLSVSQISFRGGRVLFNGSDQLSSIQVLDAGNNEVKTLNFFHSFKQAVYSTESKTYNGSNFQGTRYLDSLHIRNGSSVHERYALVYKDKFCYGNHLKGHDAWGYANASTMEIAYANNIWGNVISIPEKTIKQPRYYYTLEGGCNGFYSNVPFVIGGDRWNQVPNVDAMRRGVLQRIIYPTGGYVDFDYEANQYLEALSDPLWTTHVPQLAGGLRIRSINYFDADNTRKLSKQKYYRYGDLEEGTGIAMSKPARSQEMGKYNLDAVSYEQEVVYVSGSGACDTRNCMTIEAIEKKTTYRAASSLDYTYSTGSPVYYTKVTEYQQDLGEQTGKTVYEYYPPNHFYTGEAIFNHLSVIPGTNLPYQKTDGLMGVQKSVTEYRVDSLLNYQPVHRKKYNYTTYLLPEQVRVVYAFKRVIYEVIGGMSGGNTNRNMYNNSLSFLPSSRTPGSEYIKGEYGIPVGKLLLSAEDETHFENGEELTTTTNYTYGKLPYLQASRVTISNSKGQVINRDLKYAYDFPGIAVYDQMKADNMISQVVEKIETNASSGKELSRSKTNYKVWPVGFNLIAPETVQHSVKGGTLRTEMTINEYDQYGNVQQRTASDGIPVSYLWGYNSLYPVAELRNIKYATVPSSYKSNAQINNPTSDASLRTLLNGLFTSFSGEKEVSTYTYKRLVGLSSQTAPNGRIGYYEYDGIGRLVLQKDHELKVLNQYDYNSKGPSASNLALFSVNVPAMHLQHYECRPGIWQLYNAIVPGGKHNGINAEIVNQQARNEAMASVWYPVERCPAVDNKAFITFQDTSDPNWVIEIDFIRDDAVFATYQIKKGSTTIRFPEGEYKLSFRPKANVNYTGVIRYNVLSTGVLNLVQSGAPFTFERGTNYWIKLY